MWLLLHSWQSNLTPPFSVAVSFHREVAEKVDQSISRKYSLRPVICALCLKAKRVRAHGFQWISNTHDCNAELDIDEAMTFPLAVPAGWHFWLLMKRLDACYTDGHEMCHRHVLLQGDEQQLFLWQKRITYLATHFNCHRRAPLQRANTQMANTGNFFNSKIVGMLVKAR